MTNGVGIPINYWEINFCSCASIKRAVKKEVSRGFHLSGITGHSLSARIPLYLPSKMAEGSAWHYGSEVVIYQNRSSARLVGTRSSTRWLPQVTNGVDFSSVLEIKVVCFILELPDLL